MPTDDERREAARRLREDAKRYLLEGRFCSNEMPHRLAKAIECRYVGAGPQISELFPRLADLIDPGELKTTCIAEVKIEGEKLEEVVNRAIAEYTGIDRDALLELADEFDDKADYIASCIESMEGDFDMHAVEAEAEQREYARRIREACGEGEA